MKSFRVYYSAGSNRLVVPPVKLSTVDSRAFPVAAVQLWNSLAEDDIVLADSLSTLRRKLKDYLFQQIPRCCTVTVAKLCSCDAVSGPSVCSSYLDHRHYKNH